jgi:hypothetical protein
VIVIARDPSFTAFFLPNKDLGKYGKQKNITDIPVDAPVHNN